MISRKTITFLWKTFIVVAMTFWLGVGCSAILGLI